MPAKTPGRVVAQNRRARHDYFIDENVEAGIVLVGTEVKSLRSGRASLVDGFAEIDHWLSDTRIGTGARRDDVLDACAVAIAACEPAGSVPEGLPQLDGFGLPMQIWF